MVNDGERTCVGKNLSLNHIAIIIAEHALDGKKVSRFLTKNVCKYNYVKQFKNK